MRLLQKRGPSNFLVEAWWIVRYCTRKKLNSGLYFHQAKVPTGEIWLEIEKVTGICLYPKRWGQDHAEARSASLASKNKRRDLLTFWFSDFGPFFGQVPRAFSFSYWSFGQARRQLYSGQFERSPKRSTHIQLPNLCFLHFPLTSKR